MGHQIDTTLKVTPSRDALIVTEISQGWGRPGDAAFRFNEITLHLDHLDAPNKVAVVARDGTIITPNSDLLYALQTGDSFETKIIERSNFFSALRQCTNTDAFAAAAAAITRNPKIPADIRTKLLDALRAGTPKPRRRPRKTTLLSPRVNDGR